MFIYFIWELLVGLFEVVGCDINDFVFVCILLFLEIYLEFVLL